MSSPKKSASSSAEWDRIARRVAAGGTARRPAPAMALAYSRDERQSLALLLLPFVILAFAMGLTQTMKSIGHPTDVAMNQPEVAAPRIAPAPKPSAPPSIAADPRSAAIGQAARIEIRPAETTSQSLAGARASDLQAVHPAIATQRSAAAPDSLKAKQSGIESAPSAMVTSEALTAATAPTRLAALPVPQLETLAPQTDATSIAALEVPDINRFALPSRSICTAPAGSLRSSRTPSDLATPLPADRGAFGDRLAAAARTQLSDLVVYTDRYRRIAYPMGDVSPLFGVCTDVVIRAYRALGLDLQALVQHARMGSGDTSIDHRRVDTLRRFFATQGASLRPSEFPEDYKPGDIVTYYRPQNRHSRSHIAIVADEIGPSGNPMIIHNRGWGPQVEDGLFVDQITGHYRFTGTPASAIQTAAITTAAPAPAIAAPAAVSQPANKIALAATGSRQAQAPSCQPGRRAAAPGGAPRMCLGKAEPASARRPAAGPQAPGAAH